MLSDRFEFEMFPSVSLFGKIIPMYGLCMVLGIILSCSAAFARAKKFKLDINNLIVIAAAAVGFVLALWCVIWAVLLGSV